MSKLQAAALILIVSVFQGSRAFGQAEGSELWADVREAAFSCIERHDLAPIQCWVKATPRKCEDLALDGMVGSKNKLPWIACVMGCYDAGWYSRNFGDCYRELD